MSLTYGELFAGYGGLGMGVQSVLGGEMKWCAEFDKAPSKILAHHWPDVPNLGDVTKVDWASVPKVDVITGGSPCQDLSHAGKRAGMTTGTRSNLWVEMREAIATIRPSLVVWENVRGAFSAAADSALEQCAGCVGDAGNGKPALRALGRVLGDLSDLGYDAWWYGLRAADVGAAHGRFRVFVFAVPADSDVSGLEGLADSSGAAQAGRHGHVESGAGGPDLTLLPTPAVNDMGAGKTVDAWDAWTERMRAEHGNGNGHGKSLSIEAQRLLPTPNTHNWKESGHCRDFGADMTHALTCGCDGGRHDSTQADAAEELRDLRDAAVPSPLWQAPRGLLGLHEAQALQSDVREQSPRGNEGCAPLASEEAPQGCVPGVRCDCGPSCAPRGQESREQRPREPHDAVRELSPPSPLAGGPDCAYGCGASCAGHGSQSWQSYEAAIRRWEVRFGRPAPDPTELSRDGKPRLSARFCEWLMALPEGHVTNVPDISRNDQLKALGNGVVPPQAAAATRAFLHDYASTTKAVAS